MQEKQSSLEKGAVYCFARWRKEQIALIRKRERLLERQLLASARVFCKAELLKELKYFVIREQLFFGKKATMTFDYYEKCGKYPCLYGYKTVEKVREKLELLKEAWKDVVDIEIKGEKTPLVGSDELCELRATFQLVKVRIKKEE